MVSSGTIKLRLNVLFKVSIVVGGWGVGGGMSLGWRFGRCLFSHEPTLSCVESSFLPFPLFLEHGHLWVHYRRWRDVHLDRLIFSCVVSLVRLRESAWPGACVFDVVLVLCIIAGN